MGRMGGGGGGGAFVLPSEQLKIEGPFPFQVSLI